MLSIESFRRIYKSRIEKQDNLEELPKPEQIELIRVEEENGNYHNRIGVHPKNNYKKG